MKTTLHKSNTRGVAEHGWLKSFHTFSFANYYNPERMGFGALRVINDDVVDPGMGFGAHPHRDMEIISIPLTGSLHHQDSMGNDFVIRAGEVQIMSAGTGVVHSEFNNSSTEKTNFLQIWVIPKETGGRPRYSQKEFSQKERLNKFQLIVSPDGRMGSTQIRQNAYFSLIDLEKGREVEYSKIQKENGIYFFVINGSLTVGIEELERRDGLEVFAEDNLALKANETSNVLVMEVPLI